MGLNRYLLPSTSLPGPAGGVHSPPGCGRSLEGGRSLASQHDTPTSPQGEWACLESHLVKEGTVHFKVMSPRAGNTWPGSAPPARAPRSPPTSGINKAQRKPAYLGARAVPPRQAGRKGALRSHPPCEPQWVISYFASTERPRKRYTGLLNTPAQNFLQHFIRETFKRTDDRKERGHKHPRAHTSATLLTARAACLSQACLPPLPPSAHHRLTFLKNFTGNSRHPRALPLNALAATALTRLQHLLMFFWENLHAVQRTHPKCAG